MYKKLLLAVAVTVFVSNVIAQSNVGIGTNTPASKATVSGNMAVGSSYANIAAPADGAIIQGTVGIGTSAPNSSTILDINASNKGVKFPNVNLQSAVDVTTVPSPPKGLVVWNTGVNWGTAGLYINNGTSGTPAWDKVNTGSVGSVTGVTASTPLSSSGGAAPNITLSGTVPVANGGTGLNTFGGTNTVLYTPSANTLAAITTANNGVLATNGSGAPSITSTLPAAVQSNITATGTVASGTWNGTRIGLAYGGTNTDLSGGAAVGDMLIANSTTSFARLAAGTSGMVLKSNGPGNAPTWQTDNTSSGTVTGTGAATQVAFWNNTSALAGSNNLYWDNTNIRLGIGTNGPAERLDLGANPSVFMQGNSNAWGFKMNVNDYGGGNVPLRFIKRNSGTDTEVMRLNQNGHLGILNNNPSYPLDVTGSARVSANLYWGGPGTNGIEASTGDGASYTTYNFALRGWYGMALTDYTGTVHGVYDFRTGNLTTDGVYSFKGTGNNLLAGKLGIGTVTSPTYALDIQGSGASLQVKRADGIPSVSGGTTTTSGGYTYVVFTSSGTFNPNGAANIEVLMVGGGGGGGANGGGGGGAGGVVYYSSYGVGNAPITVTVGGGGGGGVSTVQGSNGGNTSFGSLIAYGGGGGASRDGGTQGQAGGSGGGGGGASASPRHVPGSAPYGQGNSGGYGTNPDQGCNSAGGGGGGAGGNGGGAGLTAGGAGGAGVQYSQFAGLIAGSPSGWFAGGGGGGPTCAGTHGAGGSGIGGSSGTAGVANTGSGGGGAGAAGGSGVVIIRYPTSTVFTVAPTLVAATNGYVGVGTNNPQVPLHVVGSSATNAATSSIRYINYGGGSSVNQNTAWSGPVTIYSEGDIMSKGSVISTGISAFSDRRIKDVIGLTDNKKDLDIVNRIQVTKYKYIDSIGTGNKVHTKVIAQQIEQIYPEAVIYTTNYLPDIYCLSENVKAENGQLTITINKVHKLQVADKVKMIDDKGVELIADVLKVNNDNSFTIAGTDAPEKLFVFGKQVKDFRAVDYEALSMLGISAIQELTKKIEALEQENATLKSGIKAADDIRYNELKAQVDELKNLMQKNGIRTEK